MFSLSLIAISFIYCIFIVAVILADSRINKDKLSAVKMISYFAVLEAFVMFWFAVNQTSLFDVVLSSVSQEYVIKENIIIAYLFSLISFSFLVFGVFVFSYRKLHFLLFFERTFLNLRFIHTKSFLPAFVIFCSGLLVYMLFLQEVGGISELIANMGRRTAYLIGKGGYVILFSYLVLIPGILISIYFISKRRFFLFFFFFIIIGLVEMSSGSRWNFILYIFSLFILYHYTVNEFKSVINTRSIFVGGGVIFILLLAVYFRIEPTLDDNLNLNPAFFIFKVEYLYAKISPGQPNFCF